MRLRKIKKGNQIYNYDMDIHFQKKKFEKDISSGFKEFKGDNYE